MACVQLQGGPGNVTGRISRQEMLPALTPAPGLALTVEDAGIARSAPQHWSPLCPPTLQLQTSSWSQCLPASVHSQQQTEKQPQDVSPGVVNSPRRTQMAALQGTGSGCFALSEQHHPQCPPRPSAPDSPAHNGQHLEGAASSGHSYRKGTQHPLPGAWNCSSREMAPGKGLYRDLIT